MKDRMIKQKSIKLNFVMNMILTMSSFIFPLISYPYVSRILLPVGTGKVSFATSLISYFLMFSQLGIPTYGIRACAKVRDNKDELTRTAQELLIINLITSAVSYIALFFTLLFVPRLQEDKLLYFVISFTIILTSIGMEWLYKALELYTYITIRSIIFKFAALIAMFFLVYDKSDYVIYGGITIFAASASNILNFINVHKYINMKPVGNYDFKKHFKPIVTFFAMACATTVYTNLDNVMLGFMTSDTDVGYYSAAVKIKQILVSIVTSIGAVLLPRASYYIENGMIGEFKRITKKALSFVILVAIPLMIFFIFFAREVIFFLYGDAYSNSITPMKLVMPTILLIGLSNILGLQILVPLGKEKILLYAEITGAIVDLIVNLILIPIFASSGAAIGSLSAELVVTFMCYWSIKDQINDTLKQIHYSRILLAIILGLLISAWAKTLSLGNFATLLISSFLFFGVYGLYLWFRKEAIIIEIWNIMTNKLRAIFKKA